MIKFRTFAAITFLVLALSYVLINIFKFSLASSPEISTMQEIKFALTPVVQNFDTLRSTSQTLEAIGFLRSKCSEMQLASSIGRDSLYVVKVGELCKTIERLPTVNTLTDTWQRQEIYARLKYIDQLVTHYVDGRKRESVFALFIKNTGDFIGIVFTWPFIFFLFLLYLAIDGFNVRKISEFLHPFKSIQLFGASIELGEKAKTESQHSIREFRDEVKRKFTVQVRKFELQNKIETVYAKELSSWFKTNNRTIPEDFRMTIHVSDLLFDESLFQLTDYYPGGSGRGRIFSIRYGIIGLAWRLAETQINGNIPTEKNRLVAEWGMTKDQANSAGSKRQSMAAIYIRDKNDGTGLGILYMDSSKQNIFGTDNTDSISKDLEKQLLTGLERAGVTSSLKKLKEDLSEHITEIKIYEN